MTNEVNKKPAKSSPAPKAKKERQKGKIGKFFRDLMGEIKKITWPSVPTVFRNMGVTLVVILVIGVIVFALDFGLNQLLGLIMEVAPIN